MTPPQAAEGGKLTISLMGSFFEQQFKINDSREAMKYWQVYDRTENTPLPQNAWSYNAGNGTVTIEAAAPPLHLHGEFYGLPNLGRNLHV